MSRFLTATPEPRNSEPDLSTGNALDGIIEHVTIVRGWTSMETPAGSDGGRYAFAWYDPDTLRVSSVCNVPGCADDPRGDFARDDAGNPWRKRLRPLLRRLAETFNPSSVVDIVERDDETTS